MQEGEYPTQLGTTYFIHRPVRKARTHSVYNPESPVYVDGKMKLYDKNFDLITSQPINSIFNKENPEEQHGGPFSFQSYTPNSVFPEFGLLQFPDYHLTDKKDEYIGSLIQWHKKALQFTSGILLPNPILAKTYETSRPSVFEKNSPEFRKYNPIKDNPTPKNLMFLHSKLFEENPDLEEPFPQQIPRRDIVITKHQMTNENQWQSQMIAQEPLHLLYRNFEEFESAYKNWYVVCNSDIQTPPIRPHQFVEILGIEKQPKICKEKFTFREAEHKQIIDYSWAENLGKAKCNFSLDRIKRKKKTSVSIYPDNTITINVDRTDFISDMMDYGVHWAALSSPGTLNPSKYVYYEYMPEEDQKMEKFIQKISPEISTSELLRFLFINYDTTKFPKFLNSRSGKTLFKTILDSKIRPCHLRSLFEIAEYTDQFALRVALVFPSLTSSPNSIDLANHLLMKENINDLYRFTKLEALLSKNLFQIYEPLEVQNEFSILVCQLHYASTLLSLPVSQFCMPFETQLLSFCKKTTKLVIEKLHDGTTIEHLWNSLKSDEVSHSSTLMEILESIPSDSIMLALTKNGLLDCIVKMTKYKIGRKFINKLIFTKGGKEAARLIRKSSDFTTSIIQEIDEVGAFIIAIYINEYSLFLRDVHCYVPLQNLNSILLQILVSYTPKFNPIIRTIVSTLCTREFISPEDVGYYEGLIANFCGQICIQSTLDKTISVNDAIQILLPCIRLKAAVEQISNNQDFCALLITEMNGTDMKNVHKAWKLFQALASSMKLLTNVFRSPESGKALQAIATSENPLIFLKFSEFITMLADAPDNSVLDYIEKQITSSIGRIACTYKNSTKLFHDYPKTLNCTENMCVAVLNTNGNFKQSLSNHLSSLGIDWKKIAAKRAPIK